MDRTRGIGGSDIAALMGISPWNTAYGVYQDKIQKSQRVYQLSNPLRKITMTILTKSLLVTALSVVNLLACVLTNDEIDLINKDRKSTRLNSSHSGESRMPSSA